MHLTMLILQYCRNNCAFLTDLFKIELLKLMYSFKSEKLPIPLSNIFTGNADVHNHNTRNKHDPHYVRINSHFVLAILLTSMSKVMV